MDKKNKPQNHLNPPFHAYKGEEPYIFVSYAHRDAQRVFPELVRFHEEGYPIWYDQGIAPAKEWPKEIEEKLLKSSLFVVFISENAVESDNVRNEVNLAIYEKIPVMAIYLEETELKHGLKLKLNSIQGILKYSISDEEYVSKYTDAFNNGGIEPFKYDKMENKQPYLPIAQPSRLKIKNKPKHDKITQISKLEKSDATAYYETMTIEEIKEKLNKLFSEGNDLLATKYKSSSDYFDIIPIDEVDKRKFINWKSKCISYFEKILKEKDYRLINFKDEVKRNYYNHAEIGMVILESIIDEINDGVYNFKEGLIENTIKMDSSLELPELDFNELNVFISYSWKDYESALKVYEMLNGADIECFLAQKDLKGGVNWNPIILQKLKSSNMFILMLSEDFRRSEWCNQEASIAFSEFKSKNAFMIPIYLDSTRPYGIFYDVQGIDFYDFDSLDEFVELIDVPDIYFEKALKKGKSEDVNNMIDELRYSASYSTSNEIFKKLRAKKVTVEQVNEILEIAIVNEQVLNSFYGETFLTKHIRRFEGELDERNVKSFKDHWNLE